MGACYRGSPYVQFILLRSTDCSWSQLTVLFIWTFTLKITTLDFYSATGACDRSSSRRSVDDEAQFVRDHDDTYVDIQIRQCDHRFLFYCGSLQLEQLPVYQFISPASCHWLSAELVISVSSAFEVHEANWRVFLSPWRQILNCQADCCRAS